MIIESALKAPIVGKAIQGVKRPVHVQPLKGTESPLRGMSGAGLAHRRAAGLPGTTGLMPSDAHTVRNRHCAPRA